METVNVFIKTEEEDVDEDVVTQFLPKETPCTESLKLER